MTNITAADVKRLRDLTGAGMMDCKKALQETDGDFEAATELLREKGAAKAAKRGVERSASNGVVAATARAMVSLKCETDFVAKNDKFIELANQLVQAAADHKVADTAALGEVRLDDGRTVAEAVEGMGVVIGEKVVLGEVFVAEGTAVPYLHRRATDLPPQVGVLVEYEGGDEQAARSIGMQIAAMRPRFVTRDDVPAEVVDEQRREAEEMARSEGKPEQAVPRIIEGRVNKFFRDNVLVEQASILDSKKAVTQVLADAGLTVRRFARFEVGEPQGQPQP